MYIEVETEFGTRSRPTLQPPMGHNPTVPRRRTLSRSHVLRHVQAVGYDPVFASETKKSTKADARLIVPPGGRLQPLN